MYNPPDHYVMPSLLSGSTYLRHRRVRGGGGQGVLTPPFPGPPFSSVTPLPTQPDLTDKCNINCFLIV